MARIQTSVALIAGPTASGKSALALALAEQTRRRDRQRRQRADLSRPADPQRRARRARIAPGPSTGFTACLTAASPARRRNGRSWRGAEIDDVHARGPIADPGRRDRPLPAHAARRDRAGAADRSRGSASRSARRTVEENRRRARKARSRKRRRGSIRPTRRGSPARSKSSCRPDGRWPSGSGSARAGSASEIELRPLVLLPPRDWLYARCDERFAAMVEQARSRKSKRCSRASSTRTAGHARDRRARDRRLLSRRDHAATRRSPRASRRRAATPSANIPGSRTSRRPNGRGSPSRWTSTARRRAGAARSRSA